MFSIGFIHEIATQIEPLAEGFIVIDDFKERFASNVSYWSEAEYTRQWRHTIEHILSERYIASALITSLTEPSLAQYITWWPLYREDRIVYVRNQILFVEHIFPPFNPWHTEIYVPSRKDLVENGDQVSEWPVSIDDLEAFLAQRSE